ncbi:hypothetical protein BJX66DRAFT_155235 [Aspergillus keveii]|uniref:Uncharacterized protein n=1 Tax=Aspergillus keveii TaxID=714993 RepID=A0ABR4FIK2_9EURO
MLRFKYPFCFSLFKIRSIPNKPDISHVNLKPAKKCFVAITNCRMCERSIKKRLEDLNQGSPGSRAYPRPFSMTHRCANILAVGVSFLGPLEY